MKRSVFRLFLALLVSVGLLASFPVSAGEKVILVMDASGSMWGKIQGKPKIQVAREVIGNILKDWKPENEIGLIAYGHRKKGDCSDIETLVPVGKLDKSTFMEAVNGLNPKGRTPLSEAVRQAAEQLKYTEDKATVILVSDGRETCDADPCALAAELEKKGVDFTVHVVGFDVSDKQGLEQLRCMAKNTGGDFFAAADAAALKDALATAVKKVEEKKPDPNAKRNVHLYTALKAGGPKVDGAWFYVYRAEQDADGTTKRVQVASSGYGSERSFKLPPGEYIAVAKLGDAKAEVPLTVEPGKDVEQEINLDAGRVRLYSVLQPGGKPTGSAWFRIFREEKDEFGKPKRIQVATGGYGSERTFTVPAGEYVAVAKLGDASAEVPLTMEAGGKVEQEINLGAGRLRLISVLAPGGKPKSGAWFYVYREEKDEFGKRKRIRVASSGYGSERTFTLPAGDYVAVVTLGNAKAEVPVRIEAGKGAEQVVSLDAGLLKTVSGEKGTWFNVYREDKDEFGKPKLVKVAGGGYGSEHIFTLPAGEYVVKASNNSRSATTRVTVTAGKGVEARITLSDQP